MAVGTQFLSIYTDLRAEVRRSTSVSVGVDDLDNLKRVINHVYRTLYIDHEWPHLRKVYSKIQMAAGQRYYDFPADLEPDRVTEAVVWSNNVSFPIPRGIGFEEYGVLDPDEDERQDPPQCWDNRFTGTSTQIEIWPLPASADHSIQLKGYIKLGKLVNDTDKCWLDDELVLLFSAAEVLKAEKADDADSKLQLAQGYLQRLKANSKGAGKRYAIGLGNSSPRSPINATINIKPSGS
jgi:hypothetical protein